MNGELVIVIYLQCVLMSNADEESERGINASRSIYRQHGEKGERTILSVKHRLSVMELVLQTLGLKLESGKDLKSCLER